MLNKQQQQSRQKIKLFKRKQKKNILIDNMRAVSIRFSGVIHIFFYFIVDLLCFNCNN